MTIKEIEATTGLPRANIRYYESEGFLHPERGENGYRNFTQSDVDTLLKIKLLRQLGFSLEDIRACQKGEEELSAALARRLAELEQTRGALEETVELCRAMLHDSVRFQSLDAHRYLDRTASVSIPAPIEAPWEKDTAAPPSPWRRFLARTLDLMLCLFLYHTFLQMVFRVNLTLREGPVEILDQVAAMGLMLVLEPLCIHFWGATPGKALFGLRLTQRDGSPLGYLDALRRTFLAMAVGTGFWGLGNWIPLLSLVSLGLMAYSFWRVVKGRSLYWETDWNERYTDGNRPGQQYWSRPSSYVRLGGAAALVAVILLLPGLLHIWAMSPRYQGEGLTTEQFVQNYNQFSRFLAWPGTPISQLTPDGTFQEPQNSSNVISISLFDSAPVELEFTQEEGVLTAVSCAYRFEDSVGTTAALPTQVLTKTLWSFLYGRPGLSRDELVSLITQLEEHPAEPLSWSQDGMQVSYQPALQGYQSYGSSALVAEGSGPHRVQVDFTVLVG